MTRYRVTRDVSHEECPWIADYSPMGVIPADTIVYKFTGPTYGVVDEFPASLSPNTGPCFELPWDSVEVLDEVEEEVVGT